MKRSQFLSLALILVVLGAAFAWAAPQGTVRPPTATDLRRHAFRKAPEAIRANAWRVRIRKAEQAGTWTPEQRAVFTLAHAALQKPGFYARTKAARARVDALSNLIAASFTREQGAILFGTLDDADLVAGGLMITPGIRLANRRSDCSCSTSSDWCGGGACYNAACTPGLSGCGSFWYYQCDGECVSAGCPVPEP